MIRKIFSLLLGITERGVITGLALGSTKINAKAVGIHPSTGQSLIYSEVSVVNSLI